MHKHIMIPAVLALSVALAACSSTPNANLEEARSNYSDLQANPKAPKLAPLETQDASTWLLFTEQAYIDDEDEEDVDQLAYLTNKRVEVAKHTIAKRSAEAKLKHEYLKQARSHHLKDHLHPKLKVKQTARGTQVTLNELAFATNQAVLAESALIDIHILAELLQQYPDNVILIEGYTDSTGPAAYNQQLSESRAASVGVALIEMGVSPQRIITRGKGASNPVADNSTAAGRAQNRRVEVTLAKDKKAAGAYSSKHQ